MSRFRLGKALRRLRRDERGIALPVAMLTTAIGMTFAAVVVVASVSTQRGDARDQASNSALAAADAAANLAVLRQNKVTPRPSNSLPCVVESSGKLALAPKLPSGWCSEVVLTSSPAGTTAKYQVRPVFSVDASNNATGSIEVVATGSTTGTPAVVRRIQVTAAANVSSETLVKIKKEEEEILREQEEQKKEEEEQKSEGQGGSSTYNPFNYGQITGIESLLLRGNSKVYNGGAGSNGVVEIIDSSKVCGGLRYGPGTKAPVGRWDQVQWVRPESEQPYSNGTGGGVCFGELPSTGTVSYPSVVAPSDIATNNSNSRITNKQDQANTSCGNLFCNIGWNAANRELEIKYDFMRMEGVAPYFLCKLILTGGSVLKTVPGRPLRIFFDEPKNCPGLNNAAQLTINGGTKVESDNKGGPGFYLLGSATKPSSSKVYFGNGAASGNLVIYAPDSAVEVTGGINLNGAILGRTLKLEGGANINPSSAHIPPPAGEFTTVPPSGPDPAKVKIREEKRIKREEERKVREERIKSLREETGSFKRGAYVECTAAGQLGSGC